MVKINFRMTPGPLDQRLGMKRLFIFLFGESDYKGTQNEHDFTDPQDNFIHKPTINSKQKLAGRRRKNM